MALIPEGFISGLRHFISQEIFNDNVTGFLILLLKRLDVQSIDNVHGSDFVVQLTSREDA